MADNNKSFDVAGLNEFFYFDNDSDSVREELPASSDSEEDEANEVDRDEDMVGDDILDRVRSFMQKDQQSSDDVVEDEEDDDGDNNGNCGDADDDAIGGDSGGGDEKAVEAAEELSLQQLAKCKCPAGKCISLFQKEQIDEVRLLCDSLESKNLCDMLILGKISCGINRSEKTSRSRDASKTRVRTRNIYRHEVQMDDLQNNDGYDSDVDPEYSIVGEDLDYYSSDESEYDNRKRKKRSIPEMDEAMECDETGGDKVDEQQECTSGSSTTSVASSTTSVAGSTTSVPEHHESGHRESGHIGDNTGVKEKYPDYETYNELKARLVNVSVPVYNRVNGLKNYSKVDYCYYCEKACKSKISRHYKRVHRNEKAVKAGLSKVGKRMDIEFLKLQNLGNFKHNSKVVSIGEGELVVVKRPAVKTPAHHFIPCTYCFGFFHGKSISRHLVTCPAHDKPGQIESNSHMLSESRTLLGSYLCKDRNIEEDLQVLIGGLSETQANPGLLGVIRGDDLIRKFAHGLLQRLGGDELQRPGTTELNHIRSKVRTLARLLLHAKQTIDVNNYRELLLVKNFDQFLKSASEFSVKNPQIGLSMGGHIKQLNMLRISEGIQTGNHQLQQDAENFRHLFDTFWKNCVSSVAGKRQKLRSLNQIQDLPLACDMEALSSHLKNEIVNFKGKPTPQVAKSVLAFLILFNKRRPMEVAEIYVADYLTEIGKDHTDNEEILNSLGTAEKILAERMKAIEVRGKSTRGVRKVYVIIPDFVLPALNYLCTLGNKFLFQSQNSVTPLCGTTALRDEVVNCPGLKKPSLLHAQKLRKYLATTCQILNMKDGELQMVADHMGHSTNIHTTVYRLQQNLLERSKMAKILLASEEGTLAKYTSSTDLERINLDDVPVYDDSMRTIEPPAYDDAETSYRTEDTAAANKPPVPDDAETACRTDEPSEEVENKRSRSCTKGSITRKGWTKNEKEIFNSIYVDRDAMPDRLTMDRLRDALPDRSKLVLRARASNLKFKKLG